MPIRSTSNVDGKALVWYEGMGCVSFDNRLYCTRDGWPQEVEVLARAFDRGLEIASAHFEQQAERRSLFPTPDWFVGFFVKSDTGSRDVVYLCVERTARRKRFLYIDETNPALRKLQRWFRSCVLRRRWQARCTAFLMAGVASLGENSIARCLPLDLMALISLQLKEALTVKKIN